MSSTYRQVKVFENPSAMEKVFVEKDIRVLRIGEQKICLAKSKKEFFAFEALCPHQKQPLKDGALNAFNEIKQRITGEKGVAFFNITPISREGLNDPELVCEDNLHPSGKQYKLWVSNLYPSVRQIFL